MQELGVSQDKIDAKRKEQSKEEKNLTKICRDQQRFGAKTFSFFIHVYKLPEHFL